jgi:hypothetical protein
VDFWIASVERFSIDKNALQNLKGCFASDLLICWVVLLYQLLTIICGSLGKYAIYRTEVDKYRSAECLADLSKLQKIEICFASETSVIISIVLCCNSII